MGHAVSEEAQAEAEKIAWDSNAITPGEIRHSHPILYKLDPSSLLSISGEFGEELQPVEVF